MQEWVRHFVKHVVCMFQKWEWKESFATWMHQKVTPKTNQAHYNQTNGQWSQVGKIGEKTSKWSNYKST